MPKGPRVVDGNFAPRYPQRRGWAMGSTGGSPRRIDEFDQRPSYEDEPVYQLDDDRTPAAFEVGQTVSHGTLGPGRVVAVSGSGSDTKVVVDFGVIGKKTVYARFLHGDGDLGMN